MPAKIREAKIQSSPVVPLMAGGESEKGIGTGRAEIADEHDGTAANAVGEPAPGGGEEELHEGERGDDSADDEAFGVKSGLKLSSAKPGKSGSTMPKPTRSMKTDKKITSNDGLRFTIVLNTLTLVE